MNTRDLFHQLTGNRPYKHQILTTEAILGGRNVILCAPTGSGKTLAALIPFIRAFQDKRRDFPQKMVYSLPLRTLANSLHEKTGEILESGKLDLTTSLRTGETEEDEFFERDIVFSTIDQTLSGLLNIPLSLPRRLANINSAGIFTSFLVFDELHLLEAGRALYTSLHLLNKLNKDKPVTPFILMTATLSDRMLDGLKNLLNAEVIKVDEPDIKNIHSEKNKIRYVECYDNHLNPAEILDKHRGKSIVITNTVKSAQKFFTGIGHILKERGILLPR